jgi:thioredoxin reductase (NADPH)
MRQWGMSTLLPRTSVPDPRTDLFPVLTQPQIDRIRPRGQVRQVKAGEILFEPNQAAIPFFVLLSGKMDIVQPGLEGETAIVTHFPGEFTGEISMISGRKSLVRGRMTEDGEVVQLDQDQLKDLIAQDSELSDILMRAFILRRLELIKKGYGNVILLGSRYSSRTLELREFLTRNGHPYQYVDLDVDKESQGLLDRFHVKSCEIPVVVCNQRTVMRSPSIQELAGCLGMNATVTGNHMRDVIIVGGGPAGLAAAVYAASEGLRTLVIESQAPGGQAGSSSKIENYLGFPTGVSGNELAARATNQAQKFGAEMVVARTVVRLYCEQRPYRVKLENGEELPTRAIVIATGAQYNKPGIENLGKFEGKGIYYGATYIESQLCEGCPVVVVGGANSAGQAAVFLSQSSAKVHLMVRRPELSSTMSRYLIQRLTENPKIEVHYNTEITSVDGGTHMERVTWQNKTNGETSTCNVSHVFLMTGASPHTEWLRGCLALDDKGFVLTGRDTEGLTGDFPAWSVSRPPQMLETSLPGVFAVGDVRAGNVKRVASAVGEGAISIHMVHRALAEL